MSVQGWRRTPRNDVGEMLNHTKIVITQQQHHRTRRNLVDDDLRDIIENDDSQGSVRQQLMDLGHSLSCSESDCEHSLARQSSQRSYGVHTTGVSLFAPFVSLTFAPRR